MRIIDAIENESIILGRVGENTAAKVRFPIASWIETYGNGAFSLLARRNGDESPYPVTITTDADYAYWTVSATDTAVQGAGECELIYTVSSTIAKSIVYRTIVQESLSEPGEVPDPYESWFDEILAAAGQVENAILKVTGATANNLPKLTAGGDIADSGIPAADVLKKNNAATGGNLVSWTASGGLQDSDVPAADVALKDGYYEELTAGAAETLTGRGDGVPADFAFRTTGGDADVADGTATIKALRGNTLFFNQLVDNGNFADGTTGWGATRCSIAVSNNILTMTVTETGIVALSLTSGRRFDVIAGRKYFVFVRATSPRAANAQTNAYVFLSDTSNTNAMPVSWAENVETTVAGIITADTTISGGAQSLGIRFGGSGVFTAGDEIKVRAVMVVDLTAMFGGGNEPTADAFRALFPLDFYTQTEFTPLHFNGAGIQTVGFQQWDGEWELGTINFANGAKADSADTVRTKNFIPVFPGQTYYIYHEGGTTTPDTKVYSRCYDAEKKYLGTGSGNVSTNAGTWTMPENCRYLKFIIQNTTSLAENEVTINLSWSGYRNGEQEEYWTNTRELPVSSYFQTGMKSAWRNSSIVRDELRADKAIQRIKEISMGDISWTRITSYTNPLFYGELPDMALSAAVGAPGYIKTSAALNNVPDRGISALTSGTRVVIRDDRYATADEFEAAVSSMMMVYELATPTETAIDPPLNLSYKVSDFGTERSLPDNTATPTTSPMIAQIVYGLNVQDTVRRLPINYISKDSFDALADELSETLGITITAEFNDETESYDFTVTDGRPLRIVEVPASATAAGVAGNIAIDAANGYLYVCVTTGEAGSAAWMRVQLATWS